MMGRLLPFFGFLALFSLLGFGIWWNQQHQINEVPSPLIGKSAPDFSLPQLESPEKLITRQDLLGQPYLLNVFASWCFACQEEHPVLMAQAENLEIKLIGYNYKDETEDAKRWLTQFGNPYDIILVDNSGRTAIDFGIYGAPESFLIDSQGIIRYKRIGPFTSDIIERELKPKIQALKGNMP